jgi:hypothetical protein
MYLFAARVAHERGDQVVQVARMKSTLTPGWRDFFGSPVLIRLTRILKFAEGF